MFCEQMANSQIETGVEGILAGLIQIRENASCKAGNGHHIHQGEGLIKYERKKNI